LSLILSGLYYLFQTINEIFIKKSNTQINVKEVFKKYNKDEIEKYDYYYPFSSPLLIKFILDYQIQNKIIDEIKVSKQTEIALITKIPITKDNLEKKYYCNINCFHFSNLFLPIHKYIFEGKTEYIFIVGTKIYSNSSSELSKFTENMANLWNDSSEIEKKEKLYINEMIFDDTGKYTKKEIGKVKNITFDNIYFQEKIILLQWLQKFKERKLYPEKLAICNKIGILLYGPPGTGKTGCISALANYLNRDIININSLDAINITALSKCFEEHKKTSIFVFDEFDYLLNANENKSEKINYQEMLLYAQDDAERKNILDMIRKNKTDSKNQIDTCFLIKLLDGIADDEDRVIIATTNNPEKINKLFLRPGRFDLKLKLGYCDYNMFTDIVRTKYEDMQTTDFNCEKQQIKHLLEKNITPLVLINSLITSTSFEHLLDILKHLGQSDYDKNIPF
jgi:SpoVK/Ycf46/Vps4 family AAA+-type ATPase